MKVIEYGKENKDTVILLHGGGLSWWNYKDVAEMLQERYHVILPILDGHSESDAAFISIEDSAKKLIDYIDTYYNGRIKLIGGLSLGGQILVEALSQRKDLCEYAVIESALVLPMKITSALIKPCISLSFPLIKKKWFSKLQFKYLRIKPELFELYYQDSIAIKKSDMIAFLKSNTNYSIKNSLCACEAKTLVLVGSKEQKIMKKSSTIISETIPSAKLENLFGYYHGELSVNHPYEYVKKLLEWMHEQ